MSVSKITVLILSGAALLSTTGCASRAVPFDTLDKAQITIMKLQQPQPQAAQPGAQPGQPQCPLQIPGVPLDPQLAALCSQAVTGLQQAVPGLQIPGLSPAVPGVTPPPQPQLPMFRQQWAIAGQQQVMDERLREQLLDLFGDEESFNAQRGNCFFPGMAVSFAAMDRPEPVDVVISFSCNQAVGYGFDWPHPQSGLTQTTHQTLTQIYQQHFGQVPPQGA